MHMNINALQARIQGGGWGAMTAQTINFKDQNLGESKVQPIIRQLNGLFNALNITAY